MRRSVRANGFTLVELLVVIGIIAVLISILIPVLGKAKASAESVKCQANLRQLVNATIMFANEHAGYLPQAENNGSHRMLGWAQRQGTRWEFTDDMWSWEFALMKYLKGNKGVYECPADKDPKIRFKWNDSPGLYPRLAGIADQDNVAASYRMNWSNVTLDGARDLGPGYASTIMISPKLTQVKPAARAIIYLDGSATAADTGFQGTGDWNYVSLKRQDPLGTFNLRQSNPYNVAYRRHTSKPKAWNDPQGIKYGRASYAFLDGHVESLTWDETWQSLGPAGPNMEKTCWQVTGFLPGQVTR